MLNFASLFNQWRGQNSNGVADILAQSDVNMTKLLDEDSFQTDYKSGNPKLAEFMKYPRYQELVEFITVVGPADDKKRSYKFPLSACEILTIENPTALDFFLPEKPLIIDQVTTQKEEVEVEVQVQVELEEGDSEPQETKPTEEVAAPAEPTEKKEEPSSETKTEETKSEEKTAEETATEVQKEKKQEEKEAKVPERVQSEKGEGVKVQEKKGELQVDTPQKKKTKLVKRKEEREVQKVEQKEVPALVLKVLEYFDGDINYTLAGYVSKVLVFLLTKRPAELMKYVLQENVMHKIINHAESRSVGELIGKVLTHESTHFLDLRREFFKQLLNRTSVPAPIEVISNLSSYLCEIVEKVATNLKSGTKIAQFNEVFFSLETITQVIKNVMSEEESVSVYNAPVLLTYLTNVPFALPEDPELLEEFMKLGVLFIEKSCQKLNVQKRNRPKLGFGRIKLVEILKFVIKENVLNCKQIVAKSKEFFPTLIALIKEYDMNNVLHNEAMKIIETALTEAEGSPLKEAILREDVLLNFIVEECEEDKKIKAGDSVYGSRKGYIAHVVNLSVKMKELAENSPSIKNVTESAAFSGVYQEFAEKELFNSRKSLAGLMKKEQKHEIMFQREDIIASHLTFLQHCPTAIFEPEPVPEQVNIEHPDLVEELQKQLEDLNVKGSQGKPVEKKAQEAVQEENEGKYWATHLEYNIDDLLADL